MIEENSEYTQAYLIPDAKPENLEQEKFPVTKEQPQSVDSFFSLDRSVDLRPPGFIPERMKVIDEIEKQSTERAHTLHGAKVVPCDVCISKFVPDKERQLELGGLIFQESMDYSSDDMSPDLLEKLYPEWDTNASRVDGRVRVHGFDDEGKYVTYCYFCDDNMCLSQHNDGPNWQEKTEELYGPSIEAVFNSLNISFIPQKEFEYLTEHAKDDTKITPLPAKPLMYDIASSIA